MCNLNAAVLVHMQCNSVCETAQQDLQSATRALFYNEQDKGLNRRLSLSNFMFETRGMKAPIRIIL